MDTLMSVLGGFEVALLPTNLLYCFVGVLLAAHIHALAGTRGDHAGWH